MAGLKNAMKGHGCLILGRAQTHTAYLFRTRYGIKYNVRSAPPRTMIDGYGGPMTIEEFRISTTPQGTIRRIQDMPYPLTMVHDPPAVLVSTSETPRDRPPVVEDMKAPDRRLITWNYYQWKRETGPRPSEQGQVVSRGARGRLQFLSHYSRRDHAEDAEKKAENLLVEYETLPDNCTDTGREQAWERAQKARDDATEARQRMQAAKEPALRRPAQTRIVGASTIRQYF
jgi:hypothetical protein